jgi:hypothetical protein
MEPLVVVGAAVAVVALVAVIWLRWRRTADLTREERPAEPPAKKAPWTRSEVLSLAGIAVGAAVGVAGLILSGDGSSGTQSAKQPNPVALSALLRQGPFSESLPDGLEATGLTDVNIADPSATGRVDALELEVGTSPASGAVDVFSHFEVYPTPDAATQRSEARIADLKAIFGPELVHGDASSYCSDGTTGGPTSWECGGASGLVYAEATVTPSSNANLPLATGTVSAILGYADEKARVAAG